MEEGSAEQIQAVSVVNAGDLVTPDRKNVRRRLVQSTLFPHKSPENKVENRENGEVKDCVEVEEDDDDEEYCGSQGRRKRKQKRKAAPQPRRSKKASPYGKQTSIEDMHERDSPDEGSPNKCRKKQKVPVRNGKIIGTKEACLGEVPDNPTKQGHLSLAKPDLWLEAKMTAEENSRMFAGRQLHPFFSTWKAGKKYQDISHDKSDCGFAQRNARNIKFGPIHVFENIKVDLDSMDWSNWTFCDGTFSYTIYNQEAMFSTFRGSAGTLHLDDIHKVSNPLATSHLPQVICLDHYPDAREDMSDTQTEGAHVLVDQEVALYELLKDIEVDFKVSNLSFISGGVGSMCSDVGRQSANLRKRIISYYLRRSNEFGNSLWTSKYQPEKASEVCGNSESVNMINEWLHHWCERDLRTSKNFSNANDCSLQDGEYDSIGSDSDMENIEEAGGLKNVLLVTGPVGSGKSAAIYACAKEQGFQVIEVNTSDWRSGALLKQKFGEAVGSHWLKRAQENPVGSPSKFHMKSLAATPTGGAAPQEFGSHKIDLIPISEAEDSSNAVRMPGNFDCSENTIACGQGEVKTLMLFEDVDATLCEDRGFISTIHQLADIGKRPMILTTNSKNPDLPDTLDREVVCFTMPSLKELLFHVNMVCTAERANIQPHIIERYIQYCKGDIRKTLMHLQFWCQGQGSWKDWNVKSSLGPLLFDLEAGHHVLPKVIPWDFPSQLSEVVEREITKPLCRMEENSGLFEQTEEKMGNYTMQNGLNAHQCGAINAEAKKKEILRKNYFAHDDGGLPVPIMNDCELSNSSGSPIAFTRRSARRNFETFLSSSSDDEICNDVILANPELCEEDDSKLLISEVDCQLQICHPAWDDSFQPFTDSLSHAGEAKMEEVCEQLSDVADAHLINDQCQSIDLSCVPESTFVPETELCDGIELLSRADLPEVLSRVLVDSSDPSICRLQEVSESKPSACNVDVNLVNDEMGDSHSENDQTDARTKGYQVIDECSRMDFCRGSKCLKKSRSRILENAVQETWNELRCTDLKHHVASEHKDVSQCLELAYRMSNLISEADLLLHKCQMDCTDLEMDLNSETFSLRWRDQQVQMTSQFTEHGYCFYAKDGAALASKMGMENTVDVAWEILASMSDSIALGKLLRQCRGRSQTSLSGRSVLMASSKTSFSLRSEREMPLHNILQSIVPPRLHFALKGDDAFHDYISTLARMSSSETLRLSQNMANIKRRSVRRAKNYLTNGALSLSPEDIAMLTQRNCYGKISSQSIGMT